MPATVSLPEMSMYLQITDNAVKYPVPIREYAFAKGRKWRFDLAYPDKKIAIEVEGGTRIVGRHSRHHGFSADCIKYAEAILRGWRVLRFTSEQVYDGTAMRYVDKILRGEVEDENE